jgi:23S rRNA pseudouridine1911/1915/1917 synthase
MSDLDKQPVAAREVLSVLPQEAGMRLDQWLAARLGPDLSRSRAQALIRDGAVTLGGEACREAKRKVTAGESCMVLMPEPEPAAPRPEKIELHILYEDAELIVVDKPAGLVVHPGAGNPAGTLVNALLHHCGDTLSGIGGVRRPGIVHRLDKDTSGVMVVAKNDRSHRALAEAFADHGRSGDLERIYEALVWGTPPRSRGTVDAPLGRASNDRTRRAVVSPGHSDARHALTHYEVAERFGGRPDGTAVAALVRCRLETGRTHQIRVHMAHIGHPLVGDPAYGRALRSKAGALPEPLRSEVAGFPRQALHAAVLAFRHPVDGRMLRFDTPPPADLMKLLEGFRSL